ncbi:guanylin-like [Varanus komodoensis]|uniref:guanylin-like n=1 Tax=Varanus komodoensis TaxID=61221 RepID=UPI001CF7707F|nr:guanylin-like [Varanus komodoensis]
MNTCVAVTLCLCALACLSDGVSVKVGDYSFPLELVKQLKNLQGASAMHPRMRSSTSVPVCSHPKLPAEFAPLCASPGAESLIRELSDIAGDPETCEICANVACSGC